MCIYVHNGNLQKIKKKRINLTLIVKNSGNFTELTRKKITKFELDNIKIYKGVTIIKK